MGVGDGEEMDSSVRLYNMQIALLRNRFAFQQSSLNFDENDSNCVNLDFGGFLIPDVSDDDEDQMFAYRADCRSVSS